MLNRLPNGKRLFIEIKCGSEILPPLDDVLQRTNRHQQVVIIGAGVQTMIDAKQLLPQVAVCMIFEYAPDEPEHIKRWAPHIEGIVAKAKAAQMDGLDMPHYDPNDMTWIETTKNAGLSPFAWTIDDESAAKHLIQHGIEGITTNRPGWLRQRLNS